MRPKNVIHIVQNNNMPCTFLCYSLTENIEFNLPNNMGDQLTFENLVKLKPAIPITACIGAL